MIIFDREGNFLRSWGVGLFKRPHGVHLAPDDTIYCTDDDWGDQGSSGVREPRRPVPGSSAGAVSLDLPD